MLRANLAQALTVTEYDGKLVLADAHRLSGCRLKGKNKMKRKSLLDFTEYKLFDENKNKLSYKFPLIQLGVAVSLGLLLFFRSKILMGLGVPEAIIKGNTVFRVADSVIAIAVCLLALLLLEVGIAHVVETHSARIEQKKKQKRMQKRAAKQKGKQYTLDTIAKMVRENDIIEIEIKTLSGISVIGSSSDCEPDSAKFFDKAYFIDKKEFEVGREKEFLDKISRMCGGESVTVLKIDGVKVQ